MFPSLTRTSLLGGKGLNPNPSPRGEGLVRVQIQTQSIMPFPFLNLPPSGPAPSKARLESELKHPHPLIGCRFDPTGRFLFVSSEDNTIQRFDLLTGKKTALIGHSSWVRGMAFVDSPAQGASELEAWQQRRDGLQSIAGFGSSTLPLPRPTPFVLISGDYHGNLIWWLGDVETPIPYRTIEAHRGWVRAVAVSPDKQIVASCGNDNAIRLWKASDGSALRVFEGHSSHVYNIAFYPDGTRLASCDLKGNVKDWNLETGSCDRDLDAKALHKYDTGFMADIGGARAMEFSADGTKLACAGITNVSNAFAGVGNPAVVLFDWKEGKPKLLKTKDAFQGTAWGVAFHPAGFIIAGGGGNGGGIWFWKGDDLASVRMLAVAASVRDLSLARDGSRFAAAGANGSAFVYTFAPGPAPAAKAPTPKK
jgi:WD40 repeat protein